MLDREGAVALCGCERGDVVDFVLQQVGSLPRPARLGVDVIGGAVRVALGVRRWSSRTGLIARCEAAPLPPVRLYARLIRSLTVFALYEREIPR